jgi:hypothetical protein
LNGKIFLQTEEIDLGEISVPETGVKIALSCRNAALALETARLTVL